MVLFINQLLDFGRWSMIKIRSVSLFFFLSFPFFHVCFSGNSPRKRLSMFAPFDHLSLTRPLLTAHGSPFYHHHHHHYHS